VIYSDLLGTPWSELNCGEVVAEGLNRMGLQKASQAVPTDQQTAANLVAANFGHWQFVSYDVRDAQVGDLILSDGPEQDLHVSLVIEPRRALTSAKRVGVYAPPISRITQVRGVYRFDQ
jgi:hypothetical protein